MVVPLLATILPSAGLVAGSDLHSVPSTPRIGRHRGCCEVRTRRHAPEERGDRARTEEIGALIPAPIRQRDAGGINADLFQWRIACNPSLKVR